MSISERCRSKYCSQEETALDGSSQEETAFYHGVGSSLPRFWMASSSTLETTRHRIEKTRREAGASRITLGWSGLFCDGTSDERKLQQQQTSQPALSTFETLDEPKHDDKRRIKPEHGMFTTGSGNIPSLFSPER